MKIQVAITIAGLVASCTGCAAGPAPVPVPLTSASETPASGTLTQGELPPTATTPAPFELNLTPLPSPTALATLEMPPPPASGPGPQHWDGPPTYPAESLPNLYFRLRYDAAAWALTSDNFGRSVLVNRALPGCLIGPASGRGLPRTGTVEHDVRVVGGVSFQISRVSLDGVPQFVAYAGGDGLVYTAFEVSVADQSDICLQSAEAVLGTLASVPADEAIPVSP